MKGLYKINMDYSWFFVQPSTWFPLFLVALSVISETPVAYQVGKNEAVT